MLLSSVSQPGAVLEAVVLLLKLKIIKPLPEDKGETKTGNIQVGSRSQNVPLAMYLLNVNYSL